MVTTRAISSDPGPVRAARRGGRPSKLTDELERELCRLLQAGASLHDAALLVEVSPSTVHSWLAEGRRLDGRPRLQEFVAAVEATRAAWDAPGAGARHAGRSHGGLASGRTGRHRPEPLRRPL